MQFRHVKSVVLPTDMINGRFEKKVVAMAWSPNGYRLAIGLADNWVYLFDENGDLQDKFPTKPGDKALNKSYSIRGLEFSPDSTKLAIAQTDDYVFIYKLGATWDEKKTICNKFSQQSATPSTGSDKAVTTLCWPSQRDSEVVFGMANGQVKTGLLKTNKSAVLYETNSFCISMAAGPDGHSFVSGHMDGSVYRYTFPQGETPPVTVLLAKLPSPPYHTRWGGNGNQIICASDIGMAYVVEATGGVSQQIDLDEGITQGPAPAAGTLALASTATLSAAGATSTSGTSPASKDVSSIAMSPSGQTVVLGRYDRFDVLTYNAARNRWDKSRRPTRVENLLPVTALTWKSDGSKLVTGSLSGAVDIYEACLKRSIYRNQYEFTYTSLSSVIVKKISTGNKLSIKSRFGLEIVKINIYSDRFLIANTPETLIAADLARGLLSEVRLALPLNTGSGEGEDAVAKPAAVATPSGSPSTSSSSDIPKYYFENENACLVFYAGEIFVIEYGVNEVVGTARSEFTSPYLVSLILHNAASSLIGTPAQAALRMTGSSATSPTLQQARKLAYLLDSQTIRVLPLSRLQNGVLLAPGAGPAASALDMAMSAPSTITHDSKIDWLELNASGTKLLFRDKRKSLTLFDLVTQTRTTLLPFCSYVQWVPESDVIVAQSRETLNVWYNSDDPSDCTAITLRRGDVVDIERSIADGRTDVIVDEGIDRVRIPLNESLIAFGSAVRSGDLRAAATILESLPNQGGAGAASGTGAGSSEAMWSQLAKLALERGDFIIAQRCYAALQDVTKSAYLEKIVQVVSADPHSVHGTGGTASVIQNNVEVRALLAALNKQFKAAELAYLERGLVDRAVAMYTRLHKWDEAVAIASSRNFPDLNKLQKDHFNYLVETKQEEKAAELLEKQADIRGALNLYLSGGHPSRAASLIMRENLLHDTALCDDVTERLIRAKAFEKAGDLCVARSMRERAVDLYKQGNCFNKAADICREYFPSELVVLEEKWGDYLFANRHFDAACQHFMEAHHYLKAATAAVESKQWTKALSIANTLDSADAKPLLRRIAQHFATQKDYDQAEAIYRKGGLIDDAVQMFMRNKMWDRAHRIASMRGKDYADRLLHAEAKKLEHAQQFKEAEKILLVLNLVDAAIDMYLNSRQFDDMLRLVSEYRSQGLPMAHLKIARIHRYEGSLRVAEEHYLKARAWSECSDMYCEMNMWDDCLRVDRENGGIDAYKARAMRYAASRGSQGISFLIQRELIDEAIALALDRQEFEEAAEIAEARAPGKLQEVYTSWAMAMEDVGRFAEAERLFLTASKPREAIDMYIHLKDWQSATRIAELHEPSALVEILLARGHQAKEQGEFDSAEAFYTQAKQPMQAINMYREIGRWDDAIRVASAFAPREVPALQAERLKGIASSGKRDTSEFILAQAKLFEQQRQFGAAIDEYLKLGLSHIGNRQALAEKWQYAVELAEANVPTRLNEVVQTVVDRLTSAEIAMPERAGYLLARVGKMEAALRTLARAGLFEEADALARRGGPAMQRLAEELRQQTLIKENRIDELGARNADLAVDVYVQTGQWDKVLQLALKQGPDAVARYSVNHAGALVKEGKFRAALQVIHQHGIPCVSSNLPLIQRIAQEICMMSEEDFDSAGSLRAEEKVDFTAAGTSFSQLKSVLTQFINDAKQTDTWNEQDRRRLALLEHLALVAHYLTLRDIARRDNAKVLAAKLSMSLLRYTQDLPVDRAYLDAGVDCRDLGEKGGWMNNAYVFFNRFVDLSNAMDDPASGTIDDKDFECSDIPSLYQVSLPSRHCATESERQEINDWVLERVSGGPRSLATRPCEGCSRSIFVGSLTCPYCKFQHEACTTSGFPILRNSGVRCTNCKKPSNRIDFNEWVDRYKECAWCHAPQKPQY